MANRMNVLNGVAADYTHACFGFMTSVVFWFTLKALIYFVLDPTSSSKKPAVKNLLFFSQIFKSECRNR